MIGLLVEKVSGKKLSEWVLEAVEAAGFEDALYIGTDKLSMPWISGGGCLISWDFLRYGLLFSRIGHGVANRKVGAEFFFDETLFWKLVFVCPGHKGDIQIFLSFTSSALASVKWRIYGFVA